MSHSVGVNRIRGFTRGFTIVELIVVMTIIVLMIAIVMPSIKQAHDSAQRVVCSAKQHNWGVAILAYASDNYMAFPDNSSHPSGASVHGYGFHVSWNSRHVQDFWRDYLFPLTVESKKTGQRDMLFCPTQLYHNKLDDNLVIGTDGDLSGGLVGYFYLPGRTYNADTDYSVAGDGWAFRQKIGTEFSQAPILTDMMQYRNTTQSWWMINQQIPFSSHVVDRSGIPAGSNMLFEDGHTAWVQNTNDETNKSPNSIGLAGHVGVEWNYYYKIPLGVY
ncbi:MAG: prepilin-type N-terminal cleavage/methylation domain-containing protein [Phycisphaera sp.]|nr:prepilin-type N-terminal cleavage/methylation domain-containing protein [Phycisphaera sp.]